MKEFRDIYLSWRQGSGHRRHIVGVIKRNATKGIRFYYFKDRVEKAKEVGFIPYAEFPEIDKEYTENVIESFGTRLIKQERADISDFYTFWEVNEKYKEDKFYLLGHTQGFLPTDNFEFLADFYPVNDLKFLTDLAGVSHLKLPVDSVLVGDKLQFECEYQNEVDPQAIKISKNGLQIGYIKKIHANVFHKNHGKDLNVTVKAVDKNGFIKRIFVKVSF
jgi:hypothetical protein